jgi:hypothetical protein
MSLAHLTDRAGIAGVVLLILLGAGLLIRITDHTGEPPQKPEAGGPHPGLILSNMHDPNLRGALFLAGFARSGA